MCNVFSRIPRLRHAVVTAVLVSVFLLQLVSIHQSAAAYSSHPFETSAASCGDVVINEIVFRPADPPDDEWVELYTVNALDAGTMLEVTDLETTGGQFTLAFVLPDAIPANRYLLVHGNDAAEAQDPTIGAANFFNAGNGSDLANSSDNVVLYVEGIVCEEVHWGSGSSPASTAPVAFGYGSTSSIGPGESLARNPNGSGTDFVRGTTSGLYNAAGGQSIGRNNEDGTLAITVGFFQATHQEQVVHFTWQTATESGTAGFSVLAESSDGPIQLNRTLISSPVIDSVMPTDYRFSASTPAEHFFLHEIGIDGSMTEYGPYSLGIAYGEHVVESSPSVQPQSVTHLYLPLTHH